MNDNVKQFPKSAEELNIAAYQAGWNDHMTGEDSAWPADYTPAQVTCYMQGYSDAGR
jgi:hypothetical protein